MIDYLASGGFAMWGVVLCGIVMIVLAVRAVVRPRQRSDADAVLLWAGVALGIGVIGTLIGLSQIAAAVSAAGQVSAGVLAGGIRLALSTTVVGALVFLAGLGSWSMLRRGVARAVSSGTR